MSPSRALGEKEKNGGETYLSLGEIALPRKSMRIQISYVR